MKIRKAIKKDVKRILELFNSDKNLTGDNSLPFKKNHIEQYILGPVFKTFVVIIDKKIVGAITVQFWKRARYSYIDVLIVNNKYRRKGIGTKLLEHIEKLSKKYKFNLIWLFSDKRDVPLHLLANKLKYQKGKKFLFFSKKI